MAQRSADTTLAVFLFTDLVDSTGWKKLGDQIFLNGVRLPHDRLFRELLKDYSHAREQDNAGDGFLAVFATPGDAVSFALRFHQALASYPWDAAVAGSGRHKPATRIGIHLGEVVEFDDAGVKKVAGQAVDLGARVMSLGRGGQTLFTRHAFDSARQHLRENPAGNGSLAWVAHGRYRFKGNDDDPLEVFGVAAEGSPALEAPADSEKAKRVQVDADDDTGTWRPAVGLGVPQRDDWILEQQLGEGGFGEVWLVRHRRTKQRRAFKFCFDAERLRSFKRELTLFRLIREALGDRDDVVPLIDIRLDSQPFYLESEYIPSGNLLQWSDSRGGLEHIPLAMRLDILAGIARTVGTVHALGIIHKDIKPSNIFIRESPDGVARPILADFGIGGIADPTLLERHGITATGFTETLVGQDSSRTGTRLYAPPESLVGKPATPARDIFALGVLLYQFVLGDLHRPLATGWEHDVEDELLREDIALCVMRDPLRRMQSALELGDRLGRLDDRYHQRKADRCKTPVTKAVSTFLATIDYFVATFAKSPPYSMTDGENLDSPELDIIKGIHETLSYIIAQSPQHISDEYLERLLILPDVEYKVWAVVPALAHGHLFTAQLSMGDIRFAVQGELARRKRIEAHRRRGSTHAT